MDDAAVFKWTLTGILGGISAWLGMLAVPVYLLTLAMVTDYITGLRAAKYRGEEISSYRGVKGIEKKIYLLVLVGLGILLDQLILYCAGQLGLEFSPRFAVAVVLAVWLAFNEIISILENVQDIGVKLPSWLMPFVRNIRSKVEETAPGKEEPLE